MIVIGSRAIKFYNNDFREPKDWDIIGSNEEIQAFLKRHKNNLIYAFPSSPSKIQVLVDDGTKIEFELATTKSNQLLLEILHDSSDTISFYDENLKVCPLKYSLLLKRALLYWPVHWDKTIDDYNFLRTCTNIINSEKEQLFYEYRLKENEDKFGKKKITLNIPEKDFFGKSKKIRIMEHDLLHEKVKFYDEPMFKQLKIYPNKPLLSKEKFNLLSFSDKIKTAQEECLAIGFERFFIPNMNKNIVMSTRDAYKSGIRLVVSKLTKGWFCDFVIENYLDILALSEEHLLSCETNIREYFRSMNSGNI